MPFRKLQRDAHGIRIELNPSSSIAQQLSSTRAAKLVPWWRYAT